MRRTPASDSPMYFDNNSGPLTVKNRSNPFVSLAAACTSIVLPQPGGPTNIIPLRVRTGARSTKTAYFVGIVSMSIKSRFALSSPPMSLSFTSDDMKLWSAIAAGTKPSQARSRCLKARHGTARCGKLPPKSALFAAPSRSTSNSEPTSISASTHARLTSPVRSATLKPSTRPPQSSNPPPRNKASSTSQPSATLHWHNICKISGRSFNCGGRSETLCSSAGGRHRALCAAESSGKVAQIATWAPTPRSMGRRSRSNSDNIGDRSSTMDRLGAPGSTSGQSAPRSSRRTTLGACRQATQSTSRSHSCTALNFLLGCPSFAQVISMGATPSCASSAKTLRHNSVFPQPGGPTTATAPGAHDAGMLG
mmetsp:Transcript_53474/g.140239  ORF Transcript_53474/g.140239 Transcript_53474/m.140239 type:complete len:365 (-) Transcript_53474:52-1146(-)